MNQQLDQRHLRLTGAYNVRDLGGYRIPGGGLTQWGRVLRADGLQRLDAADMDLLVARGLVTVIDLRRAGELHEAPNPFARHDRVAYHHVSLFDRLAPLEMIGADNLLLDLYKTALRERGAEFAGVMRIIAEAPEGAVLFHCAAGKDRTGLIAALLLLVAGVDQEDIVADYALTGSLIEPLVAGFIETARLRGLDVAGYRRLLTCEPQTMVATLVELETAHGGVEAYLGSVGIDRATVDRLRRRLIAANVSAE